MPQNRYKGTIQYETGGWIQQAARAAVDGFRQESLKRLSSGRESGMCPVVPSGAGIGEMLSTWKSASVRACAVLLQDEVRRE